MNEPRSRPGSIRLQAQVQAIVNEICADEYRTVSNAVNLLVIEALTARGRWPAGTTNDTTESQS
jgi:hypothetical protein